MVYLLTDLGYCSGVNNAINIIKKIRENNPDSVIYMNHPLVHNEETLKELNFGDKLKVIDLNSVNEKVDGVLVFCAHGHTKDEDEKKKFFSESYDALCPLLKSIQAMVNKSTGDDWTILFYGDKNHPETQAILDKFNNYVFIDKRDNLGRVIKNANLKNRVYLHTQSTILSVPYQEICDIVKSINPNVEFVYNFPCPMLKKRVEAIIKASQAIEDNNKNLIIVVGDKSSSNSNELVRYTQKFFKNLKVIMLSNTTEVAAIKGKYENYYIISSTSASVKTCENIASLLKN